MKNLLELQVLASMLKFNLAKYLIDQILASNFDVTKMNNGFAFSYNV